MQCFCKMEMGRLAVSWASGKHRHAYFRVGLAMAQKYRKGGQVNKGDECFQESRHSGVKRSVPGGV